MLTGNALKHKSVDCSLRTIVRKSGINIKMTTSPSPPSLVIGVLALQGAFEEHQHCLESIGIRTVQVR